MLQNSPKFAKQSATYRHCNHHRKIEPSFNIGHVSDRAHVQNQRLSTHLISPPQQVERQGLRSLIAKAFAIAVTISMLPVLLLTSGKIVYSAQISQAQQVRNTNTADPGFVKIRRPPLILLIETGAAAFLLVGLIAAFLAERALRTTPTATAIKKEEIDQGVQSVALTNAQLAPQFAQDRAILEQQESEAEQTRLLTEITQRVHQPIYVEEILKITVKEVRRALRTDRVLIFGFDGNWSGIVVAESVAPGWPQTLRVKIDDPCLRDRHHVEMYQNGRVRAVNNIYQEPGLTDCHIRTLEQFGVKANLIAPILKNNKLLGLMIAHHCSEARVWQKHEVDLFAQLATQIGFAVTQASFLEQQEFEAEQAQSEAEQARLLTEITQRIRQHTYVEEIFKTTVKEVRRALRTDRVLIFGFDGNWSGIVVAESVAPGWPQTLRVKIDDPCLRDRHHVEMYQNGRVRAVNNIYQEPGLTDCHIRTLEQFGVKANLIAPILKNNKLFGLMIAHHCSEARVWQKHEVDLFAQLATQIGFVIGHTSLLG